MVQKKTIKQKFNERDKKRKAKAKAEVVMENRDAEPAAAFNWFPGHMLKAMREIKAKIQMVDLVIEIRDARVPLTSGNPNFYDTFKGKTRLILLNKANLTTPSMVKEWSEWFQKRGEPFLYLNCLDKGAVKQVLPKARKLIEEARQATSVEKLAAKEKIRFMIIGLPNTGKSTFINQLSNRNATKVANNPGETRIPLWVKVDDLVELLDTPGVMPTVVEVEEHRFWLSLINAIPDDIIGVEDPACYLLRLMLKQKNEFLKTRYKLESFDMDLEQVLQQIAKLRGCLQQKGQADLDRVFKIVLHDFRDGLLGPFCFETPS